MATPASGREGELCCSQCGQRLKPPSPATAAATAPAATDIETIDHTFAQGLRAVATTPNAVAATPAENAAFESQLLDRLHPEADWELEFQMAGVRQMIAQLERHTAAERCNSASGQFAHSAAGDLPTAPATPRRPSETHTGPAVEPRSAAIGQWLSWSAIGLGMGLLACGSVLLTWSAFANRDDLWSVGLPLVALGQGGLFLGLIGSSIALSPAKVQTR